MQQGYTGAKTFTSIQIIFEVYAGIAGYRLASVNFEEKLANQPQLLYGGWVR